MKKFCSVLLSALIATYPLQIPVIYSVDEMPQIVVSTENAVVGEEVAVSVSLKNNTGICGMDFGINYDQTKLKLTEVERGTVLFNAFYMSSGTLDFMPYRTILASSDKQDFTDDGVIVEFHFEVLETAETGFTPIEISDDNQKKYVNVSDESLEIEEVSGGVNISSKTETTTTTTKKPTTTSTTTTTTEPTTISTTTTTTATEQTTTTATTTTDQNIVTGTYGNNIKWKYDRNGTLTVSGTGNMLRYADEEYIPWKEFKSEIKKAVIEDGIINIGYYAFSDCPNLEEVSLPDSIKAIENRAFYKCKSLTKISIPDNVEEIGNYAFGNSGLKEIIIPDSVCLLGDASFSGCASLKSANVSGNILLIYAGTFPNYSSFTSITVKNPQCNIEYIPKQATIYGYEDSTAQSYAEKNGNEFISLGEYNEEYISWEFDEDSKKLTIKGKAPMPDWYGGSSSDIPWYSIKGNIETVEICNGITNIGGMAFYRCSNLTSVIIPDSVASIGIEAFRDCPDLKSCVIPKSVNDIHAGAFYNSPLDFVVIENPDCELIDYDGTFGEETVIYGYIDSTAQTYAKNYNRTFKALEDENPPVTTTTIQTTNTTTTTTETTTTTTTTEPIAEKKAGDANDDGGVNLKDVILIRRHIINNSNIINKTNSDMNKDGIINLKDVILLRRYILDNN